jgi:hypothetical protein
VADFTNMFLGKFLEPFPLAPTQSSLYIPHIPFAKYLTASIFLASAAEHPHTFKGLKKQR